MDIRTNTKPVPDTETDFTYMYIVWEQIFYIHFSELVKNGTEVLTQKLPSFLWFDTTYNYFLKSQNFQIFVKKKFGCLPLFYSDQVLCIHQF